MRFVSDGGQRVQEVKYLEHISIELIIENQSSSGDYLASPDFPVHRHSWVVSRFGLMVFMNAPFYVPS